MTEHDHPPTHHAGSPPRQHVLYEDGAITVLLDPTPAVAGQIKIIPKQKAGKLRELPDNVVNYLFFAASFAAMTVFEQLGAHGTNIIINEGLKRYGQVGIDIVPRKSDDSLNFMWEPKALSESEMANAFERLKDKTFFIGKEKPKKKEPVEMKHEVHQLESLEEGDEEDYQIRHVRRKP